MQMNVTECTACPFKHNVVQDPKKKEMSLDVETPNKRSCPGTNYTLELCFQDIIDGKSLELDLKTLEFFLRKNLRVYYNGINQKLKWVLPYLLVMFIKSWPGWQKFNSYLKKEISFEDWFNKFEKYLLYKVNYAIKSEFDKAMILMKNSQPIDDSILFKIDNSTQTMKENGKDISPFTIEVEGPAKFLNSILFCEAGADNVILREYKVNIPWPETMTPQQILNWPYVEVEFKTKELHFKRSNRPLFQRFLTLSTDKSSIKREKKIIEEADIMNEKLPREVYTLDTMKKFCNSYLNVLKQHQSILMWSKLRWQELEQLLNELLSDISHINVNDSIATNTSVVFNLAINGYARNRSLKRRDDSPCYTEWFNPRVCLSFYEFSGISYNKDYSTFHHQELENSKNLELLQMYLPILKYNCLFCNKSYIGTSGIWRHLKGVHVNEQPFLCLKCKKEHIVSELTKNRWAHSCS
nr:unnamed protein product [Callosobruchus analis]